MGRFRWRSFAGLVWILLSSGGLLHGAPSSVHVRAVAAENSDPNVGAIPIADASAVDDPLADQVESVVAMLSSEDGHARDRAERSLAPFLRDPRTLAEVFALAVAAESPEARQRLARAVVEDGRTFCALAIATRTLSAVARRGEGADPEAAMSEARSATRLLQLSMEAALALEGPPLLMRGELGDRPYVFREGLLAGVRVPIGPPVPFAGWVRWMALCLPSARPWVVDARLDLGSIAAVDMRELLPTTADALVRRVLGARDLGVIDLGVAFVIATREEVAALEERCSAALQQPPPEGEEDAEARRRERRLLDRLRADWLVERILDPEADGAGLARLFQAIAPVGSRATLALVEGVRAPIEGGLDPVPSVDDVAVQQLVSDVAEFGVDPTLDLLRLRFASSAARGVEIQQIAFLDLLRRPETAEVIVGALLERPDRRTLRFACGLASELRLSSALDSLREIALGALGEDLTSAERCDAALASFELAPLDPAVRALLTRSLGAGVRPDSLRHAIAAGLILVRTDPIGEAASASALGREWLGSNAHGSAVVGAAVAALGIERDGPEGVASAAFKEIASVAGAPGAEAWLLARVGSPLADETLAADVIAAGLALDLAPSVETVLRAHASRGEKAPIAEQLATAEAAGANALSAIVLEAIRDLTRDGYRASFVKAALVRSSESPGKSAIIAELAEVLRATNAGAEVLWLDPRRRPPP